VIPLDGSLDGSAWRDFGLGGRDRGCAHPSRSSPDDLSSDSSRPRAAASVDRAALHTSDPHGLRHFRDGGSQQKFTDGRRNNAAWPSVETG